MANGSILDAVAALRAGVDLLLESDLTALSGGDAASVLDEVEVQRRRLDAADVQLVSAVEEARRLGTFATYRLVDFLVERLRIDPAEANRRVRRAEALGPRRTLAGEPLAPILPATAAALEQSTIYAAHADAVSRYAEKVDRLPGQPMNAAEIAESLLLRAAQHDYPRLVARLGESLLLRLILMATSRRTGNTTNTAASARRGIRTGRPRPTGDSLRRPPKPG